MGAKGCRHEPEAEEDIWAHLCAEHFPTMYRSVLADIKRSCDAGDNDSFAVAAMVPEAIRGRRGGRRRSDVNSNGSGSRAPWWRKQAIVVQSDSDAVTTEGLNCSQESSPMVLPQLSPNLSSRDSLSSSSSLSPMAFVCSDISTDCTPELNPTASPQALPTEACPLSGSPSNCRRAPDWRALYAKRLQKKLQWAAASPKGQRVCRERTTSKGYLASTSNPGAITEQTSEPRRVSELTQRELGWLSNAAHRLKICSLCGERFSPGEARVEPTGCCFHPGDFTPQERVGWSRSDLKQLRLYARQALRNAGGATWLQRHPRASRGHGHWLRGLGLLASDKARFRSCLEGEVRAGWSCCGGDGLFVEGCQRGMHRHF